jgi:hypothetical protein
MSMVVIPFSRSSSSSCDLCVALAAELERGIDLDQRVRPKLASVKAGLNMLLYAPIPDSDEAADVLGIVSNEVVPEIEDVHSRIL